MFITYLVSAILLLVAAFIIFRIIVRRDYPRRGRLTLMSTMLETVIWGAYLSSPYIYNPPSWAAFWLPDQEVHPLLRYVGIVLIVAGLVLGLMAMASLGFRRSFGQEVNVLKQTGVYALSRNPQIVLFSPLIERSRKMYRQSKLLSVLIAFFILGAIGCAAKKSLWGDVKTGLILQYRLPEKEALKYRITNQINQNLEMMGQSVETQINMGYVFSLKAKAPKNDAQQLGVTIDSMKVAIKAPQGEFSPDVTSVVGKSFDMTLSALGKELELSGAEAIQYKMGPSGERSIVSDFKAFFPDLAGKPVKIGDSWTTRDTLDIKDTNFHTRLLFENLNTLQGLEAMNGLECVKVTAAVKGTLSGTGKQGGADLSFKGDIVASDTWYFAYKEGILAKTMSDGSTKSAITVSGPQNMTIPMTMATKFATTLVK